MKHVKEPFNIYLNLGQGFAKLIIFLNAFYWVKSYMYIYKDLSDAIPIPMKQLRTFARASSNK